VDLGDLFEQGLFVAGHDILGEWVMLPA
jgi:hypothetical protein